MALRRIKNKRYKGTELKSGRFYRFKYKAYENDPRPSIIFMYWFSGTHPNTGREWRFFQAINFSYIPRKIRKRFIREWLEKVSRNPNQMFSYRMVKTRYPWLKIAVRRYFYSPSTYINNLEEIPLDEVEDEIISTWRKDFSRKIVTSIRSKFKKVRKAREKSKEKKRKRKQEQRKNIKEAQEKRRKEAIRLRERTIRNRKNAR